MLEVGLEPRIPDLYPEVGLFGLHVNNLGGGREMQKVVERRTWKVAESAMEE